VQSRVLFHDRSLDLVEAVRAIAVTDDGENALATGFLGR
jgi:hypothetical protein